MYIRQAINVVYLLLDTNNYRIVQQSSQKEARDAIIAEQGKKLVALAKDIIENGLNPFDLPLVVPAGDGHNRFVVIEGNRRLTAIRLMLEPSLAENTPLYSAFKRLNKESEDAIPKVMECVIAPSKEAGMVWIERKHAIGLEGAGTEPWSAIAKERADAAQGRATPVLDVVNFVLTNPYLDAGVKNTLLGSKFNITTLARLINDPDVRDIIGIKIADGTVNSDQEQSRVLGILSDVVTIIATKKHRGKKFTERLIDGDTERADFIRGIASNHPKATNAVEPWIITGNPAPLARNNRPARLKSGRGTPTTEDQPNLVSKTFRLKLPSGKVNDVFIELKTLDATKHRHAVSVLFRVFFELTLDSYLKHLNQPFKLGIKSQLNTV